MLLHDFFDLRSVTYTPAGDSRQQLDAEIILNAGHPIYPGHFPGHPVVPGVCQLQMVRELVEQAVRKPLKLVTSDNIKFLNLIDPHVNPVLECSLIIGQDESGQFSVTAYVSSGDTVFLKFKGKFESVGA